MDLVLSRSCFKLSKDEISEGCGEKAGVFGIFGVCGSGKKRRMLGDNIFGALSSGMFLNGRERTR